MHVALNLVFLVPGETGGMETYARELIPRLVARSGMRVTCLVNRESSETGGGPWGEVCPMEVVPVRARSRVEWVRGEQQHVPGIARRIGADLVHSLASTAPLRGPVPRVTTIHDLNYLLVPEAHFGLRGLGMRVLVPAAARRSRRVIVDSSATGHDLETRLGIAPGKIDVVPLAAELPAERSVTAEGELRERLGLGGRRVVVSPGAKRPHKNAEGVLAALALIDPDARPVLVVTGYRTEYELVLRERAQALGLDADLRIPDWLSPADLEGLYEIASAMVLPSRYEGFGLPVLEAMVRGVPVVTSNRSSLPEVAGDAALLVDPGDPAAIARAMRLVLEDPGEAGRLRAAGLTRAAEFSWARTAELTAASYARALGSG